MALLDIGNPRGSGGATLPLPTLAIGAIPVALAEGAGGSTAFGYEVVRSGDPRAAVSVDWSVAGSGANPATAEDFAGGAMPAGTLTIAAGATSAMLVVPVAGDVTAEPDQGFVVTLANARAALAITRASANGTILNDDAVAATATPLSNDWRLPVSAAYDSSNVAGDIAALAASSTAKTLPEIIVAGNASRTIALDVGAVAAPGGMLYLSTKYSTSWSIAAEQSTDGGATWTSLGFVPQAPGGASGAGTTGKYNDRGQWIGLAAGPARRVRLVLTAGDATALSVFVGAFQYRGDGQQPLIAVHGCSIEQLSLTPIETRDYIRSLYPTSDPVIVDWGIFGYRYGLVYSSGVQPLLATGLPFGAHIFGGNPNDFNASGRPFASDTSARKTQIRSDIDQCLSALVATGKPVFAGVAAYFDYNGQTGLETVNTNGTNDPSAGAQPYNAGIIQPAIKAAVPSSIAATIDAAVFDEYSAILDAYEIALGSVDHIHFASVGSARYQRQWAPAWRVLKGDARGDSWLEARVAQAAGAAPAWHRDRLQQLHAHLPATADSAAQANRAALASTIAGLSTAYADPAGVTLPSASSGGGPVAWFDAAKWETVTTQLAQINAASNTTALTGTTTSGSAVVTAFAQPTDVPIGAGISGAGIPAGATVTARDQAAKTLTLSAAATASASGVALTVTGANGRVAALADRTGSGGTLTQATVASQPGYLVQTANGRSMIVPAGSNCSLAATSGAILTALAGAGQAFTLGFVVRTSAFGTAGDLFGWATTAAGVFVGPSTGSGYGQPLGGLRFYADGGQRLQETARMEPWATYWFVLVYDGTTVTLHRNGVQTASASWSKAAWSPTAFRLGCRGTGTNFTNHDAGELVLFNRALGGAELAAFQTYGRTKWGTG